MPSLLPSLPLSRATEDLAGGMAAMTVDVRFDLPQGIGECI
jgi:hypothetical protein